MKVKQRKLPTVNINGTEFLVDVNAEEFREKNREFNVISFCNLTYENTCYSLFYDKRIKNVNASLPPQNVLRIPELVKLDPGGMAVKYRVPFDEIRYKNDFEVRVDQRIFMRRILLGQLPTVDILGLKYTVNLQQKELILHNCKSNIIKLNDKFDQSTGRYTFLFDLGEKVVTTISPHITNLPEGVFKIELPGDHILDPVVVAQRNSFSLNDYLMKHPIRLALEAMVIGLDQTELYEQMHFNRDTVRLYVKEMSRVETELCFQN